MGTPLPPRPRWGCRPGIEYDRLAATVNATFTHRGLPSPLALLDEH